MSDFWENFLGCHLPVGRPSLAAIVLAGTEARPTEISPLSKEENAAPPANVEDFPKPFVKKRYICAPIFLETRNSKPETRNQELPPQAHLIPSNFRT